MFVKLEAVVTLALLAVAAHAGKDVNLRDAGGRVLRPSQIGRVSIRKTCGDCHDVDARARSLHFNRSERRPDPEASDCLSCHLPATNAFNPDGTITKTTARPDDSQCVSCHSDVADLLAASVHGGPDKRPGDHPACHTCHGGSPHKIEPVANITRSRRARMCGDCHAEQARMRRYGVDPDAVSSYERSFHGKALLRFGKQNAATCTDCHGHHDVLAPCNPKAPTNSCNTPRTCGKCHTGATANFANSGANHLWLRVERTPVLRLEDVFFKVLTYGTMLGLLSIIALDLRRKVFSPSYTPKSGRAIGVIIALCFAALVSGLTIAVVHARGAEWAWIASVGLMATALIIHLATRHKRQPEPGEAVYHRLDLTQRAQHICLAASFTVLVLTGMPIKYAHVGWSHYLHLFFGGLDGARFAHRVAAVVMILTWIWHSLTLLYRWRKAGFSLASWTMWPTRKDFQDFFATFKHGLGLTAQPPRFDRFHFREKFDYFAVYWGMPIMVLSGFVLWFPVLLGRLLPDVAFAVAYIAHSDEALLALLAILIWHLYNAHFDPDHFPMNSVWYSGTLSASQMEREHPIEKEKMDAGANK